MDTQIIIIRLPYFWCVLFVIERGFQDILVYNFWTNLNEL